MIHFMKSLHFTLVGMFCLTAIIGCKPAATPDQPGQEQKPAVENVKLIEASYYGHDYIKVAGSQVEVDFHFATGTLSAGSNGKLRGTGCHIALFVVSDSVDNTFFPTEGEYTISDSYAAGTLIMGYDKYAELGYPGQTYDGCVLEYYENGKLTETRCITSGKAIIKGDASNASISMSFNDSCSFEFSGRINIRNSAKPEGEGYRGYEPETPTSFDITGTAILNQGNDVGSTDALFTLRVCDTVAGGSGYEADFVCYTRTDGSYGLYECAANTSDVSAGKFAYSAGADGDNLSFSFCCKRGSDEMISSSDPVYFLTGGSITITEQQVTGTVTSYFGSTIKITGFFR